MILYRMLTGHRPFDGSTTEEVFEDVLDREPVPPRQRDRTTPRGLERICLKCLSKRMVDRYATAADLADDLRFWIRTDEEGTIERLADPASRPAATGNTLPQACSPPTRRSSGQSGFGPRDCARLITMIATSSWVCCRSARPRWAAGKPAFLEGPDRAWRI